MTIPATGAVQLRGSTSRHGIATEFGGAKPDALSEYFRGHTYVPMYSKTTIALSGTQKFSNYRGTKKWVGTAPRWTQSSYLNNLLVGASVNVDLNRFVTGTPPLTFTVGPLPAGLRFNMGSIIAGTIRTVALVITPVSVSNPAGKATANINWAISPVVQVLDRHANVFPIVAGRQYQFPMINWMHPPPGVNITGVTLGAIILNHHSTRGVARIPIQGGTLVGSRAELNFHCPGTASRGDTIEVPITVHTNKGDDQVTYIIKVV
jgi:hypothetical protein